MMPDLIDLKHKLDSTNSMLAQLNRSLAQQPDDRALRWNYQSLEKRQRSLEQDFLSAADSSNLDVCSYRLFPKNGTPISAAGLGEALRDFQHWISIVYQAKKVGPQQDRRIQAEIADQTRLGFAYTYPGSVGVVLTITRQQLLFESNLDATVKNVFNMARERETEKILESATALGPAPVRAMAMWARHHAKFGLGADIDWRRGSDVMDEVFVQPAEFEALNDAISMACESRIEEYEINGTLMAADTEKRTFRMRLPTGDIRGKFSPDVFISTQQTVELPKRYRARISTRTTVLLSTDEAKHEHTILQLKPASD